MIQLILRRVPKVREEECPLEVLLLTASKKGDQLKHKCYLREALL